MPVVEAVCNHDAFDSSKCFYYERGRTYSIDSDSEIAGLTVQPFSTKTTDAEGNIIKVPTKRAPLPVFNLNGQQTEKKEEPQKLHKKRVKGKNHRSYTCQYCGNISDDLRLHRKHLVTHTKKNEAATKPVEDAVTEAA